MNVKMQKWEKQEFGKHSHIMKHKKGRDGTKTEKMIKYKRNDALKKCTDGGDVQNAENFAYVM